MGLSSTESINQLARQFRMAQQQTGKSIPRLMSEALHLRYAETGVGFNEFFGYRLYDTARLSRELIDSFVSAGAAHQIWEELNPPPFWGLVSDKVAFQLVLERAGFAQPRLFALFSRQGRVLPHVEALHSRRDIEDFLRRTEAYPLFGKPSDSFRSLGAAGIERLSAQRSTLSLSNGEEVPLTDFAEKATEWDNYLFQESLTPHESLVDYSGSSLSTMRVVVLFGHRGPEVFRVVWKVPKGTNMADNFWRPGNLVAHVELNGGKVYALIQSVETGYVEVGDDNPLGKRFLGSSPPLYDEAIELVRSASRVFPMFGYQAWDIALTEKGPVALELNHNGDIELLQVGAREGILDHRFRAFLQEKNVKLKNPKKSLRSARAR